MWLPFEPENGIFILALNINLPWFIAVVFPASLHDADPTGICFVDICACLFMYTHHNENKLRQLNFDP